MTRRIEAGPVLVAVGALVLLVSVFLDWYQPNVTAWEAFEVVDLLLVALAVAALVAAVGAIRPEATIIERHWLPAIVAVIAIIVAAQILDPPPSVDGDPDTGAWLALGAAVVMCIGTLLTLGRVSFALTVEGRDTRRRVSAVDARADDPPTAEGPVVTTGRTRPMGGEES
jgi:peptidoglycan/LPS O-acetylase OafA/YrhL